MWRGFFPEVGGLEFVCQLEAGSCWRKLPVHPGSITGWPRGDLPACGSNWKRPISKLVLIAMATAYRAEFLVSWNFKHIVNIDKIKGYNSINIKNGYKQLEIRSPREFEKYEND